MAVITIKIEDDNQGGCTMSASCDVDIPDDGECTPAQLTGALVMQMMDQVRNQALLEGEGE